MSISKNSDYFSKANKIGIFSCFIIVAFVATMFFSPVRKGDADTATVDTGTFTASIANSGTATINVSPPSSQAVYNGTDVITYTNTCPHGFSVALSSASDNTSLVRAGNDSYINTIPTISTNGSLTDNTWGFSTNNGTTYSAIPPLSNPVAILETTSATTNATNLNVIYGVKIDNTLPSGGYSNDVVYTLSVKPECVKYEIVWDFGDGTAASGVEYPDSLDYGEEINLRTFNPTRNGYRFLGWSNGVQTFPPETSLADINENSISPVYLTAQWEKIIYPLTQLTYMQDVTSESCEITPRGTTVTLTDSRDNNTYTVTKLDDDRCWMTQNLRLINKTITPNDSDVTSNFTIPSTIATSNWSSNNLASAKVYDTGNREYGVYYNYYAATAGTGMVLKNKYYEWASADSIYTICPKGWRLPTHGNNGEYSSMLAAYSINNSVADSAYILEAEPFNWAYSGLIDARSSFNIYGQGTDGVWWVSRSSLSTNESSPLPASISTQDHKARPYNYSWQNPQSGYSIRCIAR